MRMQVIHKTLVYVPVNDGGQQQDRLKHEPPFIHPVGTGQSGSTLDDIFFIKQVLTGPQPGKQILAPSVLQK